MRRGMAVVLLMIAALVAVQPAVVATDIDIRATVPAPSPVDITGLLCVPDPYLPEAGLVTVSFALSAPAVTTVTVSSALDGTLVTILCLESRPAGEHSFTWDGTDVGGHLVDRSWYVITVHASGGTTTDTEWCELGVSYGAPVRVFGARAVPGQLVPGVSSSELVARVTRPAYVGLQIRDAAGTLVRAWPEALWPTGAVSYLWDGTGTTGATLPTGQYTFAFTARDSGGAVAHVAGTVLVGRRRLSFPGMWW